MATIVAAIEAIQDVAAGLSGMVAAPHEPPEGIFQTPFSVSHLVSAIHGLQGGTYQIILATIATDIYVARVNLPTDYATLAPYMDSFPNALLLDPTLGSAVETIEPDGIKQRTESQVWASNKYLVQHFETTVKLKATVS